MIHLLLPRVLTVVLIASLVACGGGGSDASTAGNSDSSGTPAAGSAAATADTTTPSPYALKVTGGSPVDQIACGSSTNTLIVSSAIANATWLNCSGGLGSRVDVSPNQSRVQITYGNAAEGYITYATAADVASSTTVNYKDNTVAVNATKMVIIESRVGSKGTKPTVPTQIAVSGTLKF